MEGFGPIVWLYIIIKSLRVPIILVGIAVAAVIYLNKRFGVLPWLLWTRRILAVLTGASVSWLGFSVIAGESNKFFIIFGTFLAILSGYIAGIITRRDEVVCGLITGIGALLVFLPRVFADLAYVWQLVLDFIVAIVVISSATLGSYFALIQRKRSLIKLASPQVS